MSHVTLYHNPACSKSRAALALLQEHGIAPELVLYLETPPSVEQLEAVLQKLGQPARTLLRTDEPEYTTLGLDNPALTDTELLAALAAHPRLLQRPIAVFGERAVIGRPPEAVIALVEGR
ncbi:arsenate reductase (glutaredoxin) [Armatimonas rosea]|uniref:Arsenate reductase n=1 Tax=Armatimonas rosea TaxID=685828 RepID=A0A7W9WA16_ARMRO|nr:arsenate reductase (glutaredoxin) [Armatimonas rosea]MBB6053117.1 arsenate reductase [Armatimonas rosea]